MARPMLCLLCRPTVQRLTGLSRSQLDARMAVGQFPKPYRTAPGSRAPVAWPRTVVLAWINQQIKEPQQ